MKRWWVSDYLDNGELGILDEDNRIIIPNHWGLEENQLERIVIAHNETPKE